MANFATTSLEDRHYHADPDGDNRSNMAEYAMGGAPDVSDTYYHWGLRYELVQEAENWFVEFRFQRRRNANLQGLRYEFQVSDDLSPDSWVDWGYTVLNITPMDEFFEEVRLRLDQPLHSLDPRLFGRVKIYLDE